MVEQPPREIVSRRSRPAKAPLSCDIIVSTALDILAKEGMTGLSLRRVATALDTGAASLYVYLTNLNELHALMLDQALAEVALPEDGEASWQDRLKSYLLSYLHILNARPGLAQLAMTTVATGPNSLRMWDVLLGLLREGGIVDRRLVEAADMLLLHVTAVAAEEASRAASGQDFDWVARAMADVSAEQFPIVVALVDQGMFAGDEGDDDAQVRRALDVILLGIGVDQDKSSSSTEKRQS
jgi:AcrR family transcriptional regulator